MSWEPELEELRRREEQARRMGGEAKVERQHAAGRLTVRERIEALLDAGSFHEVGATTGLEREGEFTPANFVCGTGRIDGRKVVVGGDDFTVRGGASDASIYEKQVWAERTANGLRLPLVRLIEGTGGGGSVRSLEDLGATYVPANPGWDLVVDNLSVVPVAAAGLGPVAGGAPRRVAFLRARRGRLAALRRRPAARTPRDRRGADEGGARRRGRPPDERRRRPLGG